MAKYSTGGLGGDSGGACELCGAEDATLRTETVAGATLEVCGSCAKHSDRASSGSGPGGGRSGGPSGGHSSGGSGQEDERKRRKRAARNIAKLRDAQDVETGFEEGTDYQDDPLPYLVRGYGGIVEEARQEAGLRTDELAEKLGVDEEDLVAVEQGRAARASVGGSTVEALEEYFDVELIQE